jgi:branched-subunit amino acid transport protein AzlD
MSGGYGYGFMWGGGLIWMIVMAALVIVPFWKILPRNGIPNWVAIFAIFPPVVLILLWVVAFKDDLNSSGKNG